jgi:hypothetical protein
VQTVCGSNSNSSSNSSGEGATPTAQWLARAGAHNAALALEGALRAAALSFPRDFAEELRAALRDCAAAQRAFAAPLAAALAANPAAAPHFRSAVLPLFHPSPLLDAVLAGK